MPHRTVVCDACVLYPASLRDLLIRLSMAGLYHARWTDPIHDEWTRGVLRTNPGLKDKLDRTRALMDRAIRDCLITGFEFLIPSLTLPDPDDRHVLAAAIHWHADVILTFNLDDFPAASLARYEITPLHPDDLVADPLTTAEATVMAFP